jgi:hypothetical protein
VPPEKSRSAPGTPNGRGDKFSSNIEELLRHKAEKLRGHEKKMELHAVVCAAREQARRERTKATLAPEQWQQNAAPKIAGRDELVVGQYKRDFRFKNQGQIFERGRDENTNARPHPTYPLQYQPLQYQQQQQSPYGYPQQYQPYPPPNPPPPPPLPPPERPPRPPPPRPPGSPPCTRRWRGS